MIAVIRIHENGNSRELCRLDLLKFSEEQVRSRMEERGIRDDAFFICGFEDWNVDVILSLGQAYLLKRCLLDLYDGDEYVIVRLIRKHLSWSEIISRYYVFATTSDLEIMQILFENSCSDRLLSLFRRCQTWNNFFAQCEQQGLLLTTPKGFYRRVFLEQ